MLIDNLNFLDSRNDIGPLFENFLVTERMKKNRYQEKTVSSCFWRAYTGSEVDYIEEKAGKLEAFEFKYGKTKVRLPQKFFDNYGQADFKLINKDNYLKFII